MDEMRARSLEVLDRVARRAARSSRRWSSSTSTSTTRRCSRRSSSPTRGCTRSRPSAVDAPGGAGPERHGADRRRTVPHRRAGRRIRVRQRAPEHMVTSPAFEIDRTPVTNGAYRSSSTTAATARGELWTAEGWAWREEHADRAASLLDRDGRVRRFDRREPLDPVCRSMHVSWFEADAFARWRGRAAADRGRVGEGGRVGRRAGETRRSRGATRSPRSRSRTSTSSASGRARRRVPGRGLPVRRARHDRRLPGSGPPATSAPIRASAPGPTASTRRSSSAATTRCCAAARGPRGRASRATRSATGTTRSAASSSAASAARRAARASVRIELFDCATRSPRTCAPGYRASSSSLPPKYFYDERGSELFDRITMLPEYYPTRCEREILNRPRRRSCASRAAS